MGLTEIGDHVVHLEEHLIGGALLHFLAVQIGLHGLVKRLVNGQLVHRHQPGAHGGERVEALVAARR